MPLALGVASVVLTGYSAITQRNAANRAASDTQAASQVIAGNQIAVADHNAQAVEDVAKANAASLNATAAYNARVAGAEEAQVAIDSATNVRAMRKDAAVYLSRQKAAYAGSGIRVDTGSPLAVQVASAGRLALREAEAHREANARMQGMEAAAKAGVLEAGTRADLSLYEAKSRADIIRLEGNAGAQATQITGQAQADAYHRQGTAALLNGAARVLSTGYDLYQGGAFSPEVGTGGAKLTAPTLSNVPAPTAANTGGFGPITTGGLA